MTATPPHPVPDDLLAQLRSGLTGAVAVPGSDRYDAECATYNLLTLLRPAVVVAAADAADVRHAVRCAVQYGLPVSLTATGHQVRSPAEGSVLISLRALDEVTVDADAMTARIGGGVTWQRVLDATTPYGLAPVNGSAPTVGAVGYLLGGGHSPTLGRAKGYGADHVHAVEIVTADGELRRVDAHTDPDLFFAVRGGKGNFGVVTALEIDLFPVARFYGGAVYFPGDQAADVLHRWRRWAPSLPESAITSVAVQRLPPDPSLPEPLRGAFTVALRFAHLGTGAEGEAFLEPMRAAGQPILDTVRERLYAEVSSIHSDPPTPIPYADRTTTLLALPGEAVDRLLAVVGAGASCDLASVELRALGGALDREPAVPNAVATRGIPFVLFGFGVGAPEAMDSLKEQLDRMITSVAPWAGGREMVNFLAASEGATAEALRRVYGDEVYERLVAVKRKVDPANVFRFTHTM